MSREMNPQVFSSKEPEVTAKEIAQPAGAWYVDPTPSVRVDRGLPTNERAEMKKVETKVQGLHDTISETVKTLTLKNERLSQRMAALEQRVDSLSQELRSKYATISGRLTERGLVESEVQAMMERHNQIIRNFENKLGQVQRVCESQQLQLMNSSATLEDARREIARLKRL